MVKKGYKKYKMIHIMVAMTLIFYVVCIPLRQVMAITTESDFTYIKYSGYVKITKYIGTDTVVTIPSTIEGVSVTSIDSKAFADNQNITSVSIPNSVTSIGNEVFNNCTNLSSVSIGTGITSISYKTFASCASLTSVTIPDGVTSIGNYAFASCTGLTSASIPDSVTSIGSSAFHSCASLTSVTIPDGVTSIGNYAFFACAGLTSLPMPDSVKIIGNYAFAFCTGLTSVMIPDSVSDIYDYAFYKCTSLKSVTIKSSVTNITNLAFNLCTNLTSVTIYQYPNCNQTSDPIKSAFVKEISYRVIFKDYNKTVIATQTLSKGLNATAPEAPTRTGYTFTGWDKAFANITQDTEVTATYINNSYTVNFRDYNGTVIDTQTINEGSDATAPADPTRIGYTFKGWDKAFANITQDTVVTATYTENIPNSYTVTFKDYDGKVINTQTISEGLNAISPTDPTRTGYTFTGWDKVFANIIQNTEVMATYTKNSPNSYTVTFKDYDGTIISIQSISEGLNATAPGEPTRTGYTFKSWDKVFSNIIQNIEVMATYSKNSLDNQWLGEDTTTPSAVTVEITGTEIVGSTLNAKLMAKNGGKFTTSAAVTYEWYRISSENPGSVTPVGNGKTHKLVSGDKRNYIQLIVYCDGEEIGTDITGKIKEKLSSSKSSRSSSARERITGNGVLVHPTSNDIALGLMLQTANEDKVELTYSWGDKNLGGTVSNVVDKNGSYTGTIITAFESGIAKLPIEYSDFKYLEYIYKYEPITNLVIKVQEVVNINGENIEVPVKKNETYYIAKSPVSENLLLKEGWNTINGYTYKVEGLYLKSGWIQESNKWYYIDEISKARIENNWRLVNNKWYDFNEKGEMKTGWDYNNGKWYFLDVVNGDMITGWKLEWNIWYYLTSNGSMSIGWKNIDGLWYYFNSDGSMAANTVIDGYELGTSGAWIE